MTNDRLRPISSKRGPAKCPYCEVILTKTEAAGSTCPSCEKPFADESGGELDPHACPKCQEPVIQKRVECVACGKCGALGPEFGDKSAKCPKCREKFEFMEVPATVCEACGWMSIERRTVQIRRFWQFLSAMIFFGTVMLPVMEYWSPNATPWIQKKFGITVPMTAWLMVAALGSTIAATIAAPRRRLRKIAALCGFLGGLSTFGVVWAYLNVMVKGHRESVYGKEIVLIMFVGAFPAYWLYYALTERQRRIARKQRQQTIRV